MLNIFGKKKLFWFEWKWGSDTKYTYISARNMHWALKKFYWKYDCHFPSIIAIKEIKYEKD